MGINHKKLLTFFLVPIILSGVNNLHAGKDDAEIINGKKVKPLAKITVGSNKSISDLAIGSEYVAYTSFDLNNRMVKLKLEHFGDPRTLKQLPSLTQKGIKLKPFRIKERYKSDFLSLQKEIQEGISMERKFHHFPNCFLSTEMPTEGKVKIVLNTTQVNKDLKFNNENKIVTDYQRKNTKIQTSLTNKIKALNRNGNIPLNKISTKDEKKENNVKLILENAKNMIDWQNPIRQDFIHKIIDKQSNLEGITLSRWNESLLMYSRQHQQLTIEDGSCQRSINCLSAYGPVHLIKFSDEEGTNTKDIYVGINYTNPEGSKDKLPNDKSVWEIKSYWEQENDRGIKELTSSSQVSACSISHLSVVENYLFTCHPKSKNVQVHNVSDEGKIKFNASLTFNKEPRKIAVNLEDGIFAVAFGDNKIKIYNTSLLRLKK